MQTDLGNVKRVAQGKVRDIFEVGEQLLIVCTDRLSAFDVVLPDPIPDKGKVLTQLSAFWFEKFRGIIANHMVSVVSDVYPAELAPYREMLAGRSMLVRKAEPLPVECVVRGYLAGSGWNEYRENGRVCGVELPAGLRQADKLPYPIFTPATKATSGHDENISEARMAELVGGPRTAFIKAVAFDIYTQAAAYALERGIIIADTKFEFGMLGNDVILIDEALTPDSSRFWSVKDYQPGMSPPSFDKQFVRDWLLVSGWDKQPPAPKLPSEVIAGTAARYREAYRIITGKEME
ncbi:MAG: phosphoribosylaminoimidazolesuccinocarboxamide synthase [bacterium]